MDRIPVTLDSISDLDRLLDESERHPLLLFKHSHTCGISAEALDELHAHMKICSAAVRYAVLTVQTHREISNAVAVRLGIRHETPQAILVRSGRVVWTASHFRVNASDLKRAIGSATA